MDSFTIKDGNANGTTPNDSGGGMYIETGSPVLIYVTFSNNSAVNFGGEIYNEGNLTINNVIVANSTGGGCSNKPFNGGTLHADSDNNLIEHIGINACGLANGADGSRLLTRAITPLVPPQISARHPAAGSKLRFRGL